MFGSIGYIAIFFAKKLTFKDIILVSVVTSGLFSLMEQFLGFTVYPGLAKDIQFVSYDNANHIGLIMIISIIGHLILLSLARKMARWQCSPDEM